MARYTADSEDQAMIAKLELVGWEEPECWEGSTSIPQDFPIATMDALTVLFTGKRTLDCRPGEGKEIPEILGWHIATLIEAWGEHYHSFCQNSQEYMGWRDALFIRARALLGGRPLTEVEAVRDLEFEEMQARRTKAIIRHTQQWYSDGLALYQIHLHNQG